MTYLGVDEMDVVLSEMSEEDINQLMQDLQEGYSKKRISLGHTVTEEEESRVRDDLLSDNMLYMKAMKELKDRYEKMASEAWRKFDFEAEEYIRYLQKHLSDAYRNNGLDNLIGRNHNEQ